MIGLECLSGMKSFCVGEHIYAWIRPQTRQFSLICEAKSQVGSGLNEMRHTYYKWNSEKKDAFIEALTDDLGHLFVQHFIDKIVVTVADWAVRPIRSRDLSLGRRAGYQFTKEVTSLARPVHTLPAQRHSATFSPAKSVFVLEHQAQSAPSGFWPPRSCCTTSKVHAVRTLTVSSTRPFG